MGKTKKIVKVDKTGIYVELDGKMLRCSMSRFRAGDEVLCKMWSCGIKADVKRGLHSEVWFVAYK